MLDSDFLLWFFYGIICCHCFDLQLNSVHCTALTCIWSLLTIWFCLCFVMQLLMLLTVMHLLMHTLCFLTGIALGEHQLTCILHRPYAGIKRGWDRLSITQLAKLIFDVLKRRVVACGFLVMLLFLLVCRELVSFCIFIGFWWREVWLLKLMYCHVEPYHIYLDKMVFICC